MVNNKPGAGRVNELNQTGVRTDRRESSSATAEATAGYSRNSSVTDSIRPGRRLASILFALFLTVALVPAPAAAEQIFGAGQPRTDLDGADNRPIVTDESVRRADPGTRNLIALVGASPDGSEEEKYSIRLEREVGGKRLHGLYTIAELVEAILPGDDDNRPLANLYIVGHISLFPLKAVPERKPEKPEHTYHGLIMVGQSSREHALNLNSQFLDELDEALAERDLTPADVFAPGARIAFKVCLTARYCRSFLDALSERMPIGTQIEAYSVPYVWSTATRYPLISSVLGNFNEKYVFGEQNQGLTYIQGKWKPGAPQQTRDFNEEDLPPDFDGLESGR